MAVLTKGPTEGDLIKWDVEPNYTRETVTLLEGTSYPAGAVLGRVTADGKYRLSPDTGSDGAETAVAVLPEAVDATSADRTAVVLRRGPAIVSRAELRFDPSVDDATKRAAKEAQLLGVGIRTADPA